MGCNTQFRGLLISRRQKAMLDFGLKVSHSAEMWASRFRCAEVPWLRRGGHWRYIAGIAAFFALPNRMANVTAMRPNAQFYTMSGAEADDRTFQTGRSASG
jgi:4-carboxymuconolactone decarboxylase